MAALHPPHPHVIIHEWSADCRPSLASMLDLLRSQPPPAAETTSESSEAARSARTEHGPGPPRSASEPSHPLSQATAVSMDSDCVAALLVIAAKLRCGVTQADASGVAWPDASSLVPCFVATCLSRCVTDASYHDDAWIALSKLPLSLADRAHLSEQYARVPLLVTLPIRYLPFEYEFVAPVADDTDSSASESSEPSGPPSDCSKLFKSKWKYKIPADRYEWIMEFPIAPRSAHMQRVVFAADSPVTSLCVLVVSDRGSICDAMSSALYHRLSWGVRSPLVGVSFSRNSTIVNLYVGWLEDSSDDLPRVHVLGSTKVLGNNNSAIKPLGEASFSLDEPEDALAFARSLMTLVCHMRHDVQTARILEENAIPRWRADQEATPARSTTTRWTVEAMCEWNNNVPLGSDPSALPLAAYEEHQSSHSQSFDRFSSLRERNGRRPCPASLWLMDRYVVFHSLPPIEIYHDSSTYNLLDCEFQHQLPFFLVYRAATKFTLPSQWKNLARMPNVLHVPQGPGRSLLQAFQMSHAHASRCPTSSNLGDEAIACLEGELGTILRVSELAGSLNAASSAQSFGFIYDMLFSIMPPSHVAHFVGGPVIQLSRSNVADTVATNAHRLPDIRRLLYEHYWLQSSEAGLFEDIDEDRLLVIQRAASRFADDLSDWCRARPNVTYRRAMEAPTRGTCDLAFVARFRPVPTGDVEQVRFPHIIAGHSQGMTSRVYPTPYWPSPKYPMGLDEEQRILALDIMATAHQDYPSLESSDTTHQDRHPLESSDNPAAVVPGDLAQSSCAMDAHAETQYPAQQNDVGLAIDFPLLLVVHSVRRIRFDIGDSNRLRMCLTSAVQFLASMQILDFPLFGLFTEGTLCAVVMAWATQSDEGEPQVHFIDQNCSSYDISVPAGAFNLATFLLWLRYEHTPRLLTRLDECQRMGVFSRFGSEDACRAWSAQAQVDELMRKRR